MPFWTVCHTKTDLINTKAPVTQWIFPSIKSVADPQQKAKTFYHFAAVLDAD